MKVEAQAEMMVTGLDIADTKPAAAGPFVAIVKHVMILQEENSFREVSEAGSAALVV